MDVKSFDREEFKDLRSGVSFLNNELRLKEILRHRNSGKLLDVGCALGFFLKFAEEHFTTYGIEISPEAAQKARKISPMSTITVADAQEKYVYENDFFDVVTAFDVIEHLPAPEACLAEIFRVLKPGGYIFLQTPTDKSQWIIRDDTHVSLFSRERLVKVMEETGFDIIRVQKRRSILYINKFLDNAIRLFAPRHRNIVIDNYSTISASSPSRTHVLKKIKQLAYNFDKFISVFTPAPEMFVVARKV